MKNVLFFQRRGCNRFYGGLKYGILSAAIACTYILISGVAVLAGDISSALPSSFMPNVRTSPYWVSHNPRYVPDTSRRITLQNHFLNLPATGHKTYHNCTTYGPVNVAAAEQAGEDISRMVAEDSIAHNENSKKIAESWRLLGIGDQLFARGEYAQASAKYSAAEELNPQLTDSFVRRGICYYVQGMYSEAVNTIKNGIDQNPNWTARSFSLDDLYNRDPVSDAPRARHLYLLGQEVKSEPVDANLKLLAGMILTLEGKKDAAKRYFQASVSLDPFNEDYVKPFMF